MTQNQESQQTMRTNLEDYKPLFALVPIDLEPNSLEVEGSISK